MPFLATMGIMPAAHHVFILKLRKKLETDESLRIVNIRGVGYNLIVNG